MRKVPFFLLLSILFSHLSYSQNIRGLGNDYPNKWRTLTDNFMTWYTYTYDNIRLSQDFIGLNVDSSIIDKPVFLNILLRNKVFAFKIGTKEGKDIYKLYPLLSKDENIKVVIKEMASTEIQHYKMEDTEMPAFNFTDINGISYDKSSTSGKLIVLKCWFIGCVACVKEFPQLNKLVNNYTGTNNILFISLAIDKKEDLIKFLKTKKFKYSVVPEMKNFMKDDLQITQFPTHILIGKNGKIVKIVNRIEDMIPFLEKSSK